VLVQLSVTPEFREFALPELKALLRRTGLPLRQLFSLEIPAHNFPQEEHGIAPNCFARYPFLVLSFPDYDRHEQCTHRCM